MKVKAARISAGGLCHYRLPVIVLNSALDNRPTEVLGHRANMGGARALHVREQL